MCDGSTVRPTVLAANALGIVEDEVEDIEYCEAEHIEYSTPTRGQLKPGNHMIVTKSHGTGTQCHGLYNNHIYNDNYNQIVSKNRVTIV